MIRTVLIFLVLLTSVWIGIQLSHDPGYLLIAMNHWTLETTLWVAIPCLILFFLVLHAFLLMLHWLVRFPSAWHIWIAKRRSRHAREKTRQGLIEFSEGHWLRAKNHLIDALPDTDAPLLNYLTAARAAQEMGDSKMRDAYLREAQQSMPEAKIAVELTQAQLQLANRQWEQALATLRHLQDLAPHHPYVLKLLMHLYEEIQDWQQLIDLLPTLKRYQVVSNEIYNNLEQRTYLKYLLDLIKQNQATILKDFIKHLPKKLTNSPDILAEYSQYLINTQEYEQAEALLHRSLQKQFNEKLINVYASIEPKHIQLEFVESLLKKNAHSSRLYLCLGRISQSHQLWGKARTYYEKSIELSASPEAYAALGLLLEALHESAEACRTYKKGLDLAIK